MLENSLSYLFLVGQVTYSHNRFPKKQVFTKLMFLILLKVSIKDAFLGIRIHDITSKQNHI
jgi:hypothetical protein